MGQIKQIIFMPMILVMLLFVAIFDGLARFFKIFIFNDLKIFFESVGNKLTNIAFK